MSTINPQLPYYIAVYVLTIVLRLIKVYRERPKPEGEDKNYLFNYLYFGFDLVNVSAGVVILLSEYAPKYFATFMMIYVVLVVISYFCDDQTVNFKLRLFGHIFSSIVVIALTFYTFFGFEAIKYDGPDAIRKWRVNLVYIDTSMNRLLAAKSQAIKTSYSVAISAQSRHEAIALARDVFYSDTGPAPFVSKSEKGPATMIVIENESVVELLRN